MENIIIILGPKTEEIRKILDVHHVNSITVLDSYTSLSNFHEEYYKRAMKVDRIIITEGAFAHNPYDELTFLKEVLDTFYASYKEVFFLVSKNSTTLELLAMLKSDLGDNGDFIRIFDNESYNPRMIINYCLGTVTRKHFVKHDTEYDEIVRERIGGETTFKIEDETKTDDIELVVLDSVKTGSMDFNLKKENLLATAKSNKDLSWETSPLIKDITKLNELSDIAHNSSRYEIDYSGFYLSDKMREVNDNVIVVTGEHRSGKSTMAVGLSKSFTSTGKRVLVVETDLKSLGLSDIIERSGLPFAPMLIQDFTGFKNAIRTLVNSNKRLNAVVANSESFQELKGINHLTFINMIALSCKKYFDLVIVDIDIPSLEDCRPLLHHASKVLITVPNSVASVVSTYKSISSSDSLKTVTDKHLFVPTKLFSEVKGLQLDGTPELLSALRTLFGEDVKALPALKIEGLDIDESLYKTVKAK